MWNVIKKLIQFCSKLSDAFSKTKGVQISVCIKYINAIDGTEYIETLSRDVLSMNDKKREYSFNDDKLNDNSDFKNLLFLHNKNGKQWSQIYFLRNNLPNSFGYYNSHLDEAKLHNGIIGIVQRHIKWPLPYRSTLIVPISNPINDSLYGFLCVDSPRIYVFNKAADLQMLRSISSNSKVCELVNIPILKNQNTKF